MPLAPNTPVLVGVGFHQEKSDDPTQCSEPYRSMVQAVRKAAVDAGAADITREFESIAVLQGMWQYRNPGKLIADEIGCAGAKSIVSDLGVLQLTPFNDLCRAIAAEELEVGVVVGGEAQFRALRSMITGQPAPDTAQGEDTPPPDVHLSSIDPFCSDLESQRGLHLPAELFAIIESALRHHQGLSIEQHRDRLARLYASFSEIAARNPHAWRQEPMRAEEIRDPREKNWYVAFPYTKRHCAQWNVNQSVAVIVASAAKAKRLGLRSDSWIFPVAAVESRHVVVLAQQRTLHSHLGTVLCGDRACALAGVRRQDVAAAELYSCFPGAVQSFALDLGLDGNCPLTVTGAMPFAGGPFNHSSLEGIARMAEVLRESSASGEAPRRVGLVSNLSGIFGKQCCALLSNEPNPSGYRFDDITAEVAARDAPVPLDADYAGPVKIVGYTVMFQRDRPSHAIAICDTPAGKRTVGRTEDEVLLDAMIREEFCGRSVVLEVGGAFHLPT